MIVIDSRQNGNFILGGMKYYGAEVMLLLSCAFQVDRVCWKLEKLKQIIKTTWKGILSLTVKTIIILYCVHFWTLRTLLGRLVWNKESSTTLCSLLQCRGIVSMVSLWDELIEDGIPLVSHCVTGTQSISSRSGKNITLGCCWILAEVKKIRCRCYRFDTTPNISANGWNDAAARCGHVLN